MIIAATIPPERGGPPAIAVCLSRKIRPTETYTGKQKIEQKIAIMKKYLQEEWNINLDELRAEIRSRYPYVAGKTFDGVPVQRKDFTRLTR